MRYLVLIIFLLLPLAANAAECMTFSEAIRHPLNDKVVLGQAISVEDSLEQTLKDSAAKDPSKYNLQDFKRPMLPLADNYKIFDHAVLASFEKFCKIGSDSPQIFDQFIKKNPQYNSNFTTFTYVSLLYIEVEKMMTKIWTDKGEACQPHLQQLIQNYIQECQP